MGISVIGGQFVQDYASDSGHIILIFSSCSRGIQLSTSMTYMYTSGSNGTRKITRHSENRIPLLLHVGIRTTLCMLITLSL